MATLGNVSGSTSDEMILSILNTSASNGTLQLSCEPEVKKLLQQLDMFVSARCCQWEEQVTRLKKLLEKKDKEVELLRAALEENKRKEQQLKEAANRRENELRAHTADCEAQLVRLRSQVTRLSHSFEHLKGKRHQDRQMNPTQLSVMKQELERTKLNLHHSNEELKKALSRLTESKEMHQGGDTTERMIKDVTHDVEKRVLRDRGTYSVLQPTPTQEPAQALTQLLDKHFIQLNDDILKILK